MSRDVVIMFHSVGLDRYRWFCPTISEPVWRFERKMAALRDRGYPTAFFRDCLCDASQGSRSRIALTFDDGYLDNWVYVFPILKHYALRGTIFVNPDFVDPEDTLRPQVEWAAIEEGQSPTDPWYAGFLSWPEMREMERSGLVDVQSHAMTHTWYFKGPRVVDFWHPGAATEAGGPVWMLWNHFPEFKPRYLKEAKAYETRIPYGTPIYEHGKALATRRWSPENDLDEVIPAHVDAHGGVEFFRQDNWRESLHAVAERHGGGGPHAGRTESEDEYLGRVRFELAESKRILEHNLEKTVEAVCWPGGGVNEKVVPIARDLGYRRFTMPSAWAKARPTGAYEGLCPRMGSMSRLGLYGRHLGVATPREFIWNVEARRGSMLHWLLFRGALVTRLAASVLKGR